MWKGNLTICLVVAALCISVISGATRAVGSYVHFYKGEYLLSTPANESRPDDRLPAKKGKAILERLLSPAHMVLTGLGEAGNATLRAGDETTAALFAILGPAKRLPDWRRCARSYGYISARPGDSTVVVAVMGNTCLDNPDYVTGFEVCSSPAMLPKEYRPYLKHFASSLGIHAGLATQSGLKLGLTRAEVEEVLGKPLWKRKNTYEYGALGDVQLLPEFLITRWHWPKDVGSKPGGIVHMFDVMFVGDRVCAFYISKLYDF